MSYADRAAVLESCKYVDLVVPENEIDRDHLLEKVDADILAVGDDWWEQKVRGHDYMIANNRRVVYLPYTAGRSSSILRKSLNRFYEEQKGDQKL
jgi:glycerol-3-phosphate cytidylyltransferase-like family protein